MNRANELRLLMESFMVDERTLAEWCMISEKMVRCWLDTCLMTEEEFHMVEAILYLHEALDRRDTEIERLDKYLGVNV